MTNEAKGLLASMLEETAVGTQMVGVYVDTDGTATAELVQRTDTGWDNLTARTRTNSLEMAAKFDDIVVTLIPAPTRRRRTADLIDIVAQTLATGHGEPRVGRVERTLAETIILDLRAARALAEDQS